MKKLGILFVAAAGCAPASREEPMTKPSALAHTYSIVARDPKTGDLGVAVQSHWFSVGPIVPWAEAGVGAVATQSFVDPSYGPKGLELMRKGVAAADALAQLVKADPGEAVRQVAMVDAQGRVAAHTGRKCIDACGHHVGGGYSVQANMMLNDTVVPAMAKAYEGAAGDLAERLLVALEAAQSAGGDIRGKQSAAILVVKAKGTGRVWEDTLVTLRVEDHAEPLVELRRLLNTHRAYKRMNDGDVAVEKGDLKKALEEYGAAAKLAPDNVEVIYWAAVTLATNGRLEEARPMFKRVFAKDPNWRELTKRLQKPEIIKDPKLVEKILK
jgi:uncharacterized Ntn-hydrolase superfamily protein